MTTDTEDDDARIDRWSDGAVDGVRGHKPRSTDPDYMAGWKDGQNERKVRPVMPERPEGYYHLPIGTFDD